MDLHYANNISFINELENELANSWLEISLDAIGKNINYLQSLVPDSTKFMAVVKADAYGHGAVEIAFKAQDMGTVDYLGVANIAEAKILKQYGIYLPILVLGNVFSEQLHVAFEHDIETTISSVLNIENVNRIASESGLKAKVHLKIDSGMGRVGIRPENLETVLKVLKSSENITLKGVFTHFAESENPDPTFTLNQIDTFKKCLEIIRSYGFSDFIIHSANSSATLTHPESYFDMVRTGLSMYGIGDPHREQLIPALSLKSRIVNMKNVPEGNSLGYGRSFFTKRDSLIAIIPIGYADGLARILSNKQDVLIKGKRYPLVGNISMDQCLVDITSSDNIQIGDEVTLIGNSGNEKITAEEWAKKSYRIPYEVICGFGNRLPRKYID